MILSYYPEQDSHIRDKFKAVFELSNYATKNNFIALKAEVDKIDINKLVKVLSRLTSLKTKLDDLDVDKLKTVSVDLRK